MLKFGTSVVYQYTYYISKNEAIPLTELRFIEQRVQSRICCIAPLVVYTCAVRTKYVATYHRTKKCEGKNRTIIVLLIC
jgi:hypothetical protein